MPFSMLNLRLEKSCRVRVGPRRTRAHTQGLEIRKTNLPQFFFFWKLKSMVTKQSTGNAE